MKKILKDNDPPVEYPPELKTATRAEYTTHLRTMRKRKGCPLTVLPFLIGLSLIVSAILSSCGPTKVVTSYEITLNSGEVVVVDASQEFCYPDDYSAVVCKEGNIGPISQTFFNVSKFEAIYNNGE